MYEKYVEIRDQQALHQHNDQQVTKQGKRPRNIRTLRKGQVSKIKI